MEYHGKQQISQGERRWGAEFPSYNRLRLIRILGKIRHCSRVKPEIKYTLFQRERAIFMPCSRVREAKSIVYLRSKNDTVWVCRYLPVSDFCRGFSLVEHLFCSGSKSITLSCGHLQAHHMLRFFPVNEKIKDLSKKPLDQCANQIY